MIMFLMNMKLLLKTQQKNQKIIKKKLNVN